jgi:hypothetical protein
MPASELSALAEPDRWFALQRRIAAYVDTLWTLDQPRSVAALALRGAMRSVYCAGAFDDAALVRGL